MNPSTASIPSEARPPQTPDNGVFMQLKVLLPFEVLTERKDVVRVVVETDRGSMGLLPNRLDCVAKVVPGILAYETAKEGVVYLAVSEGILIKHGREVLVSAHRAVGGADLGRLHEAVRREFAQVDERQKKVRSVMARLESGFIKRFMEFRHG